jgi:tRNA wybutosine-synthesizing protein 4
MYSKTQSTGILENSIFIDVDFPQLIERKLDMISKCDLFDTSTLRRTQDECVTRVGEWYGLIGCDLLKLEFLENLLKKEFKLDSHRVLFVAEVSIAYMQVDDADAVIRWAASSFSNGKGYDIVFNSLALSNVGSTFTNHN